MATKKNEADTMAADLSIMPRRLLRFSEVQYRLGGVSRPTIERLIRDERFPKPVELTAALLAFDSDEIEAWLAARPRRDVLPTYGGTAQRRAPGRKVAA